MKPFFAWYDFYVGWYYNREKKILYLVPIPMCVFPISLDVPIRILKFKRSDWIHIMWLWSRIFDGFVEGDAQTIEEAWNLIVMHCECDSNCILEGHLTKWQFYEFLISQLIVIVFVLAIVLGISEFVKVMR
jgi:hypothetical protein